jgi:DNA polymerase delta subunit 1
LTVGSARDRPCNARMEDHCSRFHLVDMDWYTGLSEAAHWPAGTPMPEISHAFRLFGRLGGAHPQRSICVTAHGFLPYMFVGGGGGVAERKGHDDASMQRIHQRLNDLTDVGKRLPETWRLRFSHLRSCRSMLDVRREQRVLRLTRQQCLPIVGYAATPWPFIRVDLADQGMVAIIRDALASGDDPDGLSPWECNVDFATRFRIDTGLRIGGWVRLPFSVDRPPAGCAPMQRTSSCDIEVECAYDGLTPVSEDDPLSRTLAPLRTLSFDIECVREGGGFPVAETDRIVTISCVKGIVGGGGWSEELVLQLGETRTRTVGDACVQVFTDDDYGEREMLATFERLLASWDPDFVCTYFGTNFDLPYVVTRSRALRPTESRSASARSTVLGRIVAMDAEVKTHEFSSRQYGKERGRSVRMCGRISLDVYRAVTRTYQQLQYQYEIPSWDLSTVSNQILGEKKEDVSHEEIAGLYASGPDGRRRLASYCMQDSRLVHKLAERLSLYVDVLSTCRVTGILGDGVYTAGQQARVSNHIMVEAAKLNDNGGIRFLVPPTTRREHVSESRSVQYTGAVVLEPKRGFYSKNVIVLDFKSLYPSIMIRHNMCYTTLVRTADGTGHAESVMGPAGHRFVLPELREGLLPRILKRLLSERRRLVTEKNACTDEAVGRVLHGMQLAMKLQANSVYGFTGALVGRLPCLEISSSVTAYGREMIELAKRVIESEFEGSTVIYGDTDSVMVVPADGDSDPADLGREMCERVNRHFPSPVSLEFEQVYNPFLLMSKKRYMGAATIGKRKVVHKGDEERRRDNCPLVSRTLKNAAINLMVDGDLSRCVATVRAAASLLATQRVQLSDLVVTKGIEKEDYKSRQSHGEVARKLVSRGVLSGSPVGQRIRYVILDGGIGGSKLPQFRRAEDAVFAAQRDLKLDFRHYMKALSRPITRMLRHVDLRAAGITDVDGIFSGLPFADPGRNLSADVRPGRISSYLRPRTGCRICGETTTDGLDFCRACITGGRAIEAWKSVRINAATFEARRRRFAAVCARCRSCDVDEILSGDIKCTSRTCPILLDMIQCRHRAAAGGGLAETNPWQLALPLPVILRTEPEDVSRLAEACLAWRCSVRRGGPIRCGRLPGMAASVHTRGPRQPTSKRPVRQVKITDFAIRKRQRT